MSADVGREGSDRGVDPSLQHCEGSQDGSWRGRYATPQAGVKVTRKVHQVEGLTHLKAPAWGVKASRMPHRDCDAMGSKGVRRGPGWCNTK